MQLDASPSHLFHRLVQVVTEVFDTEQGTANLTARQVAVLITVSRCEGLSQNDLVKRTFIDRSTIANVVERLVAKGLLQRRRTNRDRRTYALRLTSEGRRILPFAERLMVRIDEQILRTLPSKDRPQFIANLEAIIAGLRRQPPVRLSTEKG